MNEQPAKGFFSNGVSIIISTSVCVFEPPQKARFVWPTWGPPGAARTQVGPTFVPMNLAIMDTFNELDKKVINLASHHH